jgi:hypothetical protein
MGGEGCRLPSAGGAHWDISVPTRLDDLPIADPNTSSTILILLLFTCDFLPNFIPAAGEGLDCEFDLEDLRFRSEGNFDVRENVGVGVRVGVSWESEKDVLTLTCTPTGEVGGEE